MDEKPGRKNQVAKDLVCKILGQDFIVWGVKNDRDARHFVRRMTNSDGWT